MLVQITGELRAFSHWRSIRTASVFKPRRISCASQTPSTPPTSFIALTSATLSISSREITDAAHRVSMSAKILRRAVDHDVRAELQRLAEIRRRERVVDNQARAILVRDLGARFDITNFQQRV